MLLYEIKNGIYTSYYFLILIIFRINNNNTINTANP
jgi:hypothetical protein